MTRIDRRGFLKVGAAGLAGLMLPWRWPEGRAVASVRVPQTPLPGKAIPKFVEPLPVFGSSDGLVPGQVHAPRVTGTNITVSMHEIQQKVLPESFYAALPAPYTAGSYLWAYNVGNTIPLYPGITVEARRGTPTTITYVNNLPHGTNPSVVQRYITVDQTLHWADPLDQMGSMDPYEGPPPAVVHLHGGEVPSDFDGGPDQWFTPDGRRGRGYRTAGEAASNAAVYRYPNAQEAATLWFHDHALGATRLNVYAGMAAFYLLRDQYDTGQPGNPLGLPAGPYEREIAIQDRQFDTNGQLIFPDSAAAAGLNGPPPNLLIHPYWNPEFFGDVIVVNGKSWPYLNVEPRRYRFHFLCGCNARFLELRLMNRDTKKPGPAFWAIGTDGGLLDMPAKLNDPNLPAGKGPRLLMGPGERYDVIIDFAGYQGQTLTLINSGKAPDPNGLAADPQTSGQIMQFRVGKTVTGGKDTSYNPSSGLPLRGGTSPMPAIIRLADPATGTPAAGVTPTVKRQLTLVEVMGPGGPVEVLVNNTRWDGRRTDEDDTPIPGSTPDGSDEEANYLTELPKVGATELWEIINLTGDSHPIHLHLAQFQLLNRQAFNVSKYRALYDSSFPGGNYGGVDMVAGKWMENMNYMAGVFIPAYGPPDKYYQVNADGALGGNPAVGRYLQGLPVPPNPQEAGWKDTVKMNPGEVTRILVRFAPQDVPAGEVSAGTNSYPFDPTTGPGYVWHCHIVDHEDNEMMRPYHPVA